MIVDCQSCGATYNISDEKVRGRRVRVRCKSCGEGIIVDGTRVDSDEATRVYSPNFEPAAYAAGVHDEATRVMSPSGPDLQATASEGEWTVAVSESDQRTMDLAELVSSYTGGLIPDEALVWREGMEDWLPVRQVPEIQAAIESNEATHVVSPAIAVRAPRRAAGDRMVPRRAEPEPARVQARAPVVAEEPEPAPAPAPPAPERPVARPAAAAPAATARVRQGRAGSTDLFGNIERAGAGEEEALLNSTALSPYEDKPIGARNESSVLFSLDALKAGARRGSSAPPRTAASPQTAADILGMSAGGALPGMGAAGALLSAPAVDAPLAAVAPALPPPRSKMDTLPPVMRARPSWTTPTLVVAAAVIVGAIAFAVLRSRVSHPTVAMAEPSAGPVKPAVAPTTPVVEKTEPAVTASATVAAAESTPPAVAGTTARPQGDGVTAPVLPSKPTTTGGSSSNLETMKAALRPDKTEAAPKPATEPPASKGSAKVVLSEDTSVAESAGEAAEEKTEEPPKPPFDTGAAKAALEAASSSVASCKKDDGPTGRGKVQVTFSPAGRATSANVIEGPFGGTTVGGCVAKIFRGAKVPPFSGDAVTVSKSFTIPE